MKLAQIAREPNAEVIGRLEQMLDQARRGEILGLVYVAMRPGGVHSRGADGEYWDQDLALAIFDLQGQLLVRREAKAVPTEDEP